jgi:hypothetical protein
MKNKWHNNELCARILYFSQGHARDEKVTLNTSQRPEVCNHLRDAEGRGYSNRMGLEITKCISAQ